MFGNRHRFFIARLVDRLPGQCWGGLIFWARKEGLTRLPWFRRTEGCTNVAVRHGRCYCGKLDRDGTIQPTGRIRGGGRRG